MATDPKPAKPFLKWAGGKTQIFSTLLDLFPKRIRTYYEPFLGGGATYFALAAQKRFDRAFLNDTNAELINAFRVVRDFPERLMVGLQDAERAYALDPAGYFQRLRELLPGDLDPIQQAVRFITLNKTTYNGLFRVNRKGLFNGPWGKKTKAKLFEPANILACSEKLNQWVQFHNGDFATIVEDAQEGDVVYFDPPYVPVNATSNFTGYTASGFNRADHERLAALFKDFHDRGVACILSNSDVPEVRALYAGFEVHEVQAKRAINSKAGSRGPVGELIIVNRRVTITPEVTL